MLKVINGTLLMEISEISKLDSVWSPEIIVEKEPWKVEVCRTEQSFLAVFLFTAKKEIPQNWAIAAHSTVKLLSFHDKDDEIERKTDPYVYDNHISGYGPGSLISWNDLFNAEKMYVKDDTIRIEIKIEAENTDLPDRSKFISDLMESFCRYCTPKFSVIVTNIHNLMAVQSPSFLLKDVPWTLCIIKSQSSNLAITLDNKATKNVSGKISIVINLFSLTKEKSIERVENHNLMKKCIQVEDIVSWKDLMDPANEFVVEGSITLQIELKRDLSDYSECLDSDASDSKSEHPRMNCTICFENMMRLEVSSTSCGHLFCTPCITKVAVEDKKCPNCKGCIDAKNLHRIFLPE